MKLFDIVVIIIIFLLFLSLFSSLINSSNSIAQTTPQNIQNQAQLSTCSSKLPGVNTWETRGITSIFYPQDGVMLLSNLDKNNITMKVSQVPGQIGTIIIPPPWRKDGEKIITDWRYGTGQEYWDYLIQRGWFIQDVRVNVELTYINTGNVINMTITKYNNNPVPELSCNKPFDRYYFYPQSSGLALVQFY